ncbi:hypothetical protein [Deminuibacter soli]|uniref:Uncharacterized protein n=1 Tax=Deminuibacter soli TaxID=2291815 RepID=A0A3E1NGC7_9BACT|nr:hypothetical protein [Deminuibacter soli]RFM26932.1 hypothetical protein DXN05_18280 [Deminuibacter soli]
MSFIHHLVQRHAEAGLHIRPRIRAKFEPGTQADNKQGHHLPSGMITPGGLHDDDVAGRTATALQQDAENKATAAPAHNNVVIAAHATPLAGMPVPAVNAATGETSQQQNDATINIAQQAAQALQAGQPVRADNALQPAAGILPAAAIQQATHLHNNSENATQVNQVQVEKSAWPQNGDAAETGAQQVLQPGRIPRSLSATDAASAALGGWMQQFYQGARNSFLQTAATQQAAQPVVKVTIGRIDVRAVPGNKPAAPAAKHQAQPTVSLSDYLKQRNKAK